MLVLINLTVAKNPIRIDVTKGKIYTNETVDGDPDDDCYYVTNEVDFSKSADVPVMVLDQEPRSSGQETRVVLVH